jgi:hypothetical protein
MAIAESAGQTSGAPRTEAIAMPCSEHSRGPLRALFRTERRVQMRAEHGSFPQRRGKTPNNIIVAIFDILGCRKAVPFQSELSRYLWVFYKCDSEKLITCR